MIHNFFGVAQYDFTVVILAFTISSLISLYKDFLSLFLCFKNIRLPEINLKGSRVRAVTVNGIVKIAM